MEPIRGSTLHNDHTVGTSDRSENGHDLKTSSAYVTGTKAHGADPNATCAYDGKIILYNSNILHYWLAALIAQNSSLRIITTYREDSQSIPKRLISTLKSIQSRNIRIDICRAEVLGLPCYQSVVMQYPNPSLRTIRLRPAGVCQRKRGDGSTLFSPTSWALSQLSTLRNMRLVTMHAPCSLLLFALIVGIAEYAVIVASLTTNVCHYQQRKIEIEIRKTALVLIEVP